MTDAAIALAMAALFGPEIDGSGSQVPPVVEARREGGCANALPGDLGSRVRRSHDGLESRLLGRS